MSQKKVKKERRDQRLVSELEAQIGKLVRENSTLKANIAAVRAKAARDAIDLGIATTALSLAMNNQGQQKAFFSKRAMDLARSKVTVSVDVAREVMTPEERAVLVAGELHFQEQKKRSESRLILPEGVEGLEDLYTPEARLEAEAWVDRGVIVTLTPIPRAPVRLQNGSVFYQDPPSLPEGLRPEDLRFEIDRGDRS